MSDQDNINAMDNIVVHSDPDTHTDGAGALGDTQALPQTTHLREILNRLSGHLVFSRDDTLLVDSDGEEGEEDLGPLQTCYRDINDLGILLLNPLAKELSEEDLMELRDAALACDDMLKGLKGQEKLENRAQFQATKAEYNAIYYNLNGAINTITRRLAKFKNKGGPGKKTIPAASQPIIPVQTTGTTTTTTTTSTSQATTSTSQATGSTTVATVFAPPSAQDQEAARNDLIGHVQQRYLPGRTLQRVNFQDTSTPLHGQGNVSPSFSDSQTADSVEDRLAQLQSQLEELQNSIQDGQPRRPGYTTRPFARGPTRGTGAMPLTPKFSTLKLANFKGEFASFSMFKQEFVNLYEIEGMGQKELAMRLYSHLEGKPKRAVQDLYQFNMGSECYSMMWKELEKLYGGAIVESSVKIKEIFLQRSLMTSEAQEVATFYEFIKGQYSFWSKEDASMLTSTANGTYQMLKLKLSQIMSKKYKKYLAKRKAPDNFNSLWEWISEINDDVVDDIKTTAARKITHEISDHRSRPQAQRSAPPPFGRRRPPAPVVKQADLEPQYETEEEDFDEIEEQNLYWQGGPESEEDESPPNPDSEIIHISRADLKAMFKKAKDLPMQIKCEQCKNGSHKLENCQVFKDLPVSKRNTYVREQGVCFHCLDGKHKVKDCTNKVGMKCPREGCDRYHHPLLHSTTTMNWVQHAQFPEEELFDDLSASCYRSNQGCSNMQTLTVMIEGNSNNQQRAIIMLDSGANVSCIDEDFAKEIEAEPLTAFTVQKLNYLDRQISLNTRVVKVNISSLNGLEKTSIEAWTVKNLTTGMRAPDWNVEKVRWPHLRELNFPEHPQDPRVYMLIGSNYPGCFVPEQIVKGESFHDPLGYLTPFGWTVLGGTRAKYELIERKTKEELKTSYRFSLFTKIRNFFD